MTPLTATAASLSEAPQEQADHDIELVQRAQLGDLAACEGLVERHQGVVLRAAARIVGDNDAHDVAQDTFLRAFHRLERFRGEAPFRT